MPQFKIKVRSTEDGQTEQVSVIADTKREANLRALALARILLQTGRLELP